MRARPAVARRRVLHLLGSGTVGAVLAGCGESPSEQTTPPASTARSELDAALQRARTVAATVTERAPQTGSSLPQPGEQRVVPVAVMPLEYSGGRLFGLFANGFIEASRQSEGRYKYDDVPLNVFDAGPWSMSVALTAAAASSPELVAYFSTDLDDLVSHRQLAPLDDFLVTDPGFDSGAFWPGLLERGRHAGVQYGLPFAVSPAFTLINGELAAERGIDLPEPSLQAFTAETFLELAQAFHEPDPPDGGTGTQGILGAVQSEPSSQGDYFVNPPVTSALLSALGGFRDAAGGFTPLETDQARAVLEFYRDLTHRHELIPVGSLDYLRYIQAGKWGMGFGTIAFSDLGEFRADNRVYPFPGFGSGRNPTNTSMLGITASADKPDAAYDALRRLYAVIAPESTLPPMPVDAPAVRRLMPELRGDDEHVIVHLLQDSVFFDISPAEAQLVRNTLVRDVLIGDTSPAEGLRRALEELQASSVAN